MGFTRYAKKIRSRDILGALVPLVAVRNAFQRLQTRLFDRYGQDREEAPYPQIEQEEGAGCNYPIGSAVRVQGQYIWIGTFTPLDWLATGTNALVPTWRADCAIAWAKLIESGVAAQGTLTLDTQPSDTDTFTIDTKTYTFQATLTDVDGNIKIGATLADSQANLVAAVNLTGVAGTDYAASMTRHTSVSMKPFNQYDQAVITAFDRGTAGNSIATTETFTAGTNVFDAATLGTTRAGVNDSGIQAINKIYGGSDEIWVDDNNKTIQESGTMSVVRPFGVAAGPNSWWPQVIQAAGGASDPDLTRFVKGQPMTETGWAKQLNNVPGTFTAAQKFGVVAFDGRRLSSGKTEVMVNVFRNNATGGAAGDPRETDKSGVTLTSTGPNVRRRRLDETITPHISNYLGTGTQADDPIVAAGIDPSNDGHPFHQFTAYSMLRGLLLVDWGNRPPPPEALINATGTTTVAQAIDYVLALTTLRTSQWDTSALTGLPNLTGINIVGQKAPIEAIEQIMVTYDLLAQERKGVLRFFKRVDAEVVTVDMDDFGAREYGDDPPTDLPFSLHKRKIGELRTELTIRYIDEDKDHEIKTVKAKVTFPTAWGASTLIAPVVDNPDSITIPIAMTEDYARSVAERLLQQEWAQRYTARGTLTRKYMHMEQSDALVPSAAVHGRNWRFLLTKVEKGTNGIVEWEGVSESTDAAVQVTSWGSNDRVTVKATTVDAVTAAAKPVSIGGGF